MGRARVLVDLHIIRVRQGLLVFVPVALVLLYVVSETGRDGLVKLFCPAVNLGVVCHHRVMLAPRMEQTASENFATNWGPLSVRTETSAP